MLRQRNLKHKSPFTYQDYKDLGWLNGGVTACSCDRKHKEELDNSLFISRGTDNIVLCHNCKTFVHYDCSD